jgi:cobyric acid synthase
MKGVGSEMQPLTLSKDAEYDKLAALVRGSLDMDLIYEIAEIQRKKRC